jgi:hypothetical protein
MMANPSPDAHHLLGYGDLSCRGAAGQQGPTAVKIMHGRLWFRQPGRKWQRLRPIILHEIKPETGKPMENQP